MALEFWFESICLFIPHVQVRAAHEHPGGNHTEPEKASPEHEEPFGLSVLFWYLRWDT